MDTPKPALCSRCPQVKAAMPLGYVLSQARDSSMHFIDLRVCDLLRVGDNAANTDEILDSLVMLIDGSLLFFHDFFDSFEPFFGCHGQY